MKNFIILTIYIARIYPVYKITVLMCGFSQIMANNCNLNKYVYRIDVNGIVTGSSTVLDIILLMFISMGSMSSCWRGPDYSEKFCW